MEAGALAERAQRVRDAIEDACREAGRPLDSVRLVAVSKRHPVASVRAAYAAGLRDFGENYAQELADKRAELADLTDVRWHFIGRVQRNKAKLFAGCELVHGVGSVDHAAAIAKRAPGTAVLAQVNASDEEQKNGFSISGIEQEVDRLLEIEDAPLRGFMAMLGAGDTGAEARARFASVRELRDRLVQRTGRALPELSMGMTADFTEAVLEGATLVRVGTAIFGERDT